MTIDEAINFVENMIYNYRPYGEQLEDWNKLLNLLCWYREQDLIRFKDVGEQSVCSYGSQCPFEHFCDRCEYAILTMNNIYNNVPKAEPPGENCNASTL